MLSKIKNHLERITHKCHSACRVVAGVTAGEIFAFFHTSIHGDFVTAYLVLSTWVKDALIKHHEKKMAREQHVVRRVTRIAQEP